jgi:L-ascorbate metabolism protein UlaG (beta-lactamase superfamily)
MATRSITLDAGAPGARTGSIFFVGNATTLIRYAGFTILTDPNFLHRGQFARLGYGLRSRRLTNPAIEVEALPQLDMVVLSHLHGDHWDEVAEAKLHRQTRVVTTPRAAETLGGKGFATEALARWQSVRFDKGDVTLRVTAMPGRHGPALFSRLLPDVMGSLLDFETRGGARLLRLYITGDTLVHDRLAEIRTRYDDIDLALLHLGGTRVLGVLVTMDAAQGVELMRIVQPRRAIPIHYDDYTVFKSPLAEFQQAAQRAGLGARLHYLAHGESYTIEAPGRIARPA